VAGVAQALPAASAPERVLTVEGSERRRGSRDAIVVAFAIAGAAAAAWICLSAGFLAHPGWLAVQRAELILGPVLVGLYWSRRRPASRFGPLLVAFGFVALGLVLQGAREPVFYSLGVLWDGAFFLATLVVVLAFPSGYLEGRVERAIVLVATALVAATFVPARLLTEQIFGGGTIAACRGTCPDNAFFVRSHPSLSSQLERVLSYGTIALALATAALLILRFVRGSAPRRRSFGIGAAVGVSFMLAVAAYHVAFLVGDTGALIPLRWTLVGAQSLLALGFFAALLRAEIFAGRVLQKMVAHSLTHPGTAEVVQSLREAVGDPRLRLGFRIPSGRLVDSRGRDLEAPAPGSGRRVTSVVRNGVPVAAIVHDEQLEEDPELLLAASAAALLVFENARLEAELGTAVRELRMSRARLVTGGDLERQRLERDLHDGLQQRLVALRIKVELARGAAGDDTLIDRRLGQLRAEIDEALSGARALARELFPSVLSDEGLAAALRAEALRSPLSVRVECAAAPRRYPFEVEAAVYYCCLEALQNAADHAGADARVVIRLVGSGDELRFSVRDDGRGFDPARTPEGSGFAIIRDRVGAFGGTLAVDAAPGRGTVVRARLPVAQVERPEPSPVSDRKTSVAVTRRLTSDSSARSSFEKIEPM
jgi:signal transduction histidine kinase